MPVARTDAWPIPQHDARRALARHLAGSGVELGPGHQPFQLPFPGVEVAYVDRWTPDENKDLFPELGDAPPFPKPDIVANLDTDRLDPLPDGSQAFVICSHVLEHMAEPLGLLDDIHRVLEPSGIALILLPDRHRTFDKDRAPTPLDHLVDEHARGVAEVDDDHVLDFLVGVHDAGYENVANASEDERRAYFDWHRRRSIHVHCWNAPEFLEVLVHSIAEMGHGWEFVDGLLTDEEGPESIEFGYVLRRGPKPVDSAAAAERFRLVYESWRDRRQTELAELERAATLEARIAALETELTDLRAVVAHQDHRLGQLRRLPGYGVARAALRATRRLRGSR